VAWIVLWAAIAVTVVTGVDYFAQGARLLAAGRREAGPRPAA